MIKLLIIFILSFASYNTVAAWTFLYPAAEGGYYMDLNSIRKDGNSVKVWTLIDITQQEIRERGIYSLKMRTEFNCKDETFRILDSITYSGSMGMSSAIASSAQDKNIETFEAIAPHTMTQKLFNTACTPINYNTRAEWTKVIEVEDNFSGYADLSSVYESENKVRIWFLGDFITPQETVFLMPQGSNEFLYNLDKTYLSEKTLSEFDCKSKTMRELANLTFSNNMGEGKLIAANFDNNLASWGTINSDSIGKILWELVCRRK